MVLKKKSATGIPHQSERQLNGLKHKSLTAKFLREAGKKKKKKKIDCHLPKN